MVDGGESTGLATASVLLREVEELRREVEELRRVVGDDGMCEGEAKLRGVDGLLRGMVGLYDFAEVGVTGDFTEAEVAIEGLRLERGEGGSGTGFCFSARFLAA